MCCNLDMIYIKFSCAHHSFSENETHKYSALSRATVALHNSCTMLLAALIIIVVIIIIIDDITLIDNIKVINFIKLCYMYAACINFLFKYAQTHSHCYFLLLSLCVYFVTFMSLCFCHVITTKQELLKKE